MAVRDRVHLVEVHCRQHGQRYLYEEMRSSNQLGDLELEDVSLNKGDLRFQEEQGLFPF